MSAARRQAEDRILVVIRQFHPMAAGAETQALRQARSYIEMGCDARVVTARYDRKLAREDTVEGVPVTRLSTSRTRFFGSIVFLGNLAAYLISHAADYDAVLVFQMKQAAAVAAVVCGFLGKRVVVSDQASGAIGDVAALRNVTLGGLILWCCKRAGAFVSGASEISGELIGAGVPAEKVHFIPNGIPMDRFAPSAGREAVRARLALPEDAFILVNVGRHTPEKDLKTVLAAWAGFAPSHPGALLVFVGDGPLRPDLEAFVKAGGLEDSVRFEGWRSSVPEYLAAADAFAAASLSEGTHIALGEAMAAGLPAVVTPVGGARDFVRPGDNGFFFDIGDSAALARHLAFLASHRDEAVSMGRCGRRTAERELSQDETARKHLTLLLGGERKDRQRRPPRIVHVIATLDTGGSERQMAELAARTNKATIETEVIALTRGGPTGAILDAAGVPHRVLGKKHRVDIPCFLRLFLQFFLNPPTAVHTWLFTSNVYGRLAAKLAGVAHTIASERSTDPWKSRAHRALDRLLATFTDGIAANSAAVAKSLTASGLPPGRISVIHNGIDTERFRTAGEKDARFALGLAVEGPYFGFVGRLAFEKRPEVFIDVARRVLERETQARAILFGDGPMRAELEEAAAPLRDRIIFYGDCPRPELAHAALDCLVLTSGWEGFPNAVLEAMASGRPVVAVRMDATAELVEPGVTGLLVDDDAGALAGAVMSVLASRESALRMGLAARRKVERLYTMAKMVAAYDGLYRQVLGMEPPG